MFGGTSRLSHSAIVSIAIIKVQTYLSCHDEGASPLQIARFCYCLVIDFLGNSRLAPPNGLPLELEGPCHQSFALSRGFSQGLELGNDQSLVLALDLVRLHPRERFLSSW